MPLAGGHPNPALADVGVQAVGQPVHPVEQPGAVQGIAQRVVVAAGPGQPQVLPDGRVEDVRVLGAEPDDPADVVAGDGAGVASADACSRRR